MVVCITFVLELFCFVSIIFKALIKSFNFSPTPKIASVKLSIVNEYFSNAAYFQKGFRATTPTTTVKRSKKKTSRNLLLSTISPTLQHPIKVSSSKERCASPE